jgi:hypothetical protein
MEWQCRHGNSWLVLIVYGMVHCLAFGELLRQARLLGINIYLSSEK